METENNYDNEMEMPRDKAELMERIQREWTLLQQAIGSVTEPQMNKPDAGGWSIKDNLAHLSAWEEFMRLYHLQNIPPHLALQINEDMFKTLDEDALNAVLFERNRDRTVADVLADLQRSHTQVLAELDQWLYEDLIQPHYPDDPEARPLINWVIGNTYAHYQEHRLNIEKLAEPIRQ
jgi:hypothetical protein